MTLSILDVTIDSNHKPFVIAEMSGNHNQSIDKALAIVDAAAEAGASALKIQTYTADTMTLDIREGAFFIENPNSLWKGNSLYQLYQEAHTPWEWHAAILNRCQERGIIGFSSPFDATAVDFLETLNVPAYKIASFELLDLALIRKVAATGKPVLMSTGMATLDEIEDAVHAVKSQGNDQIILLKCTSNYPSDATESHLRTIPFLAERFGVMVGLSDHTLGTAVAVASVALGVRVIEKHFTLSRAEGGVDAAFSLEPSEMAQLVADTHSAYRAMGHVQLGPTASEKSSLGFRRSLYICEDMVPGDVLDEKNLRAIRPGYGLAPKYLPDFLGKKVQVAVKRGTPLSWQLIAEKVEESVV